MNRLLHVARIQVFEWFSTLLLPWLILAFSFATNTTIFHLLDPDGEGPHSTGGLSTLYVFVFIAYIVAVRSYFPFLLGVSVTRRLFCAATSVLALAQALAFALLIFLFSLVEDATGGWGVQLAFFKVGFLEVDGAFLQVLLYAVPLALVSFLGLFVGAVSVRWGTPGIMALLFGSMFVSGVLVVLVTWQQKWTAVGAWFAEQTPLGLGIGWPLLLTAIAAAGSFLILRRTAA